MRLFRRLNQVVILGSLILVALASSGAAEARGTLLRAAPNEVLVRLDSRVNIYSFALAHGLRLLHASDALSDQATFRLKIIDGSSLNQKLADLKQSSSVIYAEPNQQGQIPEARLRSSWVVGGDDHAYASQWAAGAIRLDQAHQLGRGAGIVVAVLDTGLDLSHPALAGHLTEGYDFVDEDADPSEVSASSDDSLMASSGTNVAFGHGTHVAGLIALAAPEAKIMPLRTLGPDGKGDIWSQVRALRYAIEHGADVINLSYSFEQPSQAMSDVLARSTCSGAGNLDCEAANLPGVVVIAAAGNSGQRLREYPAADQAPGILAVGASTTANTLANFSTYGAWVRVMAPGDHILSTVPGGGYASWSGTSMATPLVTGVAALVRAAYPALRPTDVVSHITTTSCQTSSLVRRRLDAAAALGLEQLKSWQE